MTLGMFPPRLRGGAGGYIISGSAYPDGSSGYLSFTPSSTGNTKTFVIEQIVKVVEPSSGSHKDVLWAGRSANPYLRCETNDSTPASLWFAQYNGSGYDFQMRTNQLFRDVSAYYHLVWAFDTTQATAADRVRLWVNNTEVTSWQTSNYPSQNKDLYWNNSSYAMRLGNDFGSQYSSLYVARATNYDGLSITDPETDGFGQLTSDDGYWEILDVSEGITGSNPVDASGLTKIGNMTSGVWGGLAAAFDVSATWTSGFAGNSGTNQGYVGVDHGSGVTKKLTKLVAANTTNYSWTGNNSATVNLYVYGSNTTPSSYNDGTLLGSKNGVDNTASAPKSETFTSADLDTTTAYRYHWFVIDSTFAEQTVAYIGMETEAADVFGTNGFLLEGGTNVASGTPSHQILPSQSMEQDIIDNSLSTNLVLCLDAGDSSSYTSGQSWLDLTSNGYDFFLGATSGSEASDPTFNGTAGAYRHTNYFSTDGGDYFTYDSANETWMGGSTSGGLHHDGATFTMAFWFYHKNGSNNGLFGTGAASSSNHGIEINLNSDNTVELYHMDAAGTGGQTVYTSTATLTPNAWNFVAISQNENGGAGASIMNINGTVETFNGAYSNPQAAAATHTLQFGARGNGATPVPSGFRFAGIMAWDTNLSSANLETIRAATATRFEGAFDANGTITATNDSPTDDATNGYGNFCRWNSNEPSANAYASGNQTVTLNASNEAARGTIAVNSGRYYFELHCDAIGGDGHTGAGIQKADESLDLSNSTATVGAETWVYWDDGRTINNGANASTGLTNYGAAAVIGVDLNLDSNQVSFYLADSLEVTETISADTFYAPYVACHSATTNTWTLKIDPADWTYAAKGSGVALATQNITPPSVNPSEHAAIVLWTGSSSSPRTITGFGFDPDFVWATGRSLGTDKYVTDVLRGSNAIIRTNTTDAETDPTTLAYGAIGALTTDGFTIVSGTVDARNLDTASATYMALGLKAGGAGVSNSDGSITSTVSANTTSGFSMGTFVLGASAATTYTVGHGLGVPPACIWVKQLSGGGGNWFCYFKPLGNGNYIRLNLSNASAADANIWASTDPTSSVFSMNTTFWGTGGATYVAYCFADVADLATSIFRIGSYTGNANADGPMITQDASMLFWLIKNSDAARSWCNVNNVANPNNVAEKFLEMDTSTAEQTNTVYKVDLNSNGVKQRVSFESGNGSGHEIIYLGIIDKFLAGGADAWTQGRAR